MAQNIDPHYDAVIVLGGNICRSANGFSPSTYADSDQFGMLGGKIRVIAAALMYLNGEASTFVFSTGTSEKTKAVFGTDVPTEAEVYSEDFKATTLELVSEASGVDTPQIVLEDRSQNTVGNLRECLRIIREHGWRKVAFVSSWPHISRSKALHGMIGQELPVDAEIDFLAAEDIVKRLRPGEYDADIGAAYISEEGKKRIASEAKGVQDVRDGTYVTGEYQLHDPQLSRS